MVDAVARATGRPSPVPAQRRRDLVGTERGRDGQEAEARDRARTRLDVVVDDLAQHLVAAADPEHGRGRPAQRASASPRSRSHARSATVDFVPGRTTRSGAPSARAVGHEAHADAGLGDERVEIGEVRDAREADDRDVELVGERGLPEALGLAQRQRVLGVDAGAVDPREHTERRQAGAARAAGRTRRAAGPGRRGAC